MRVLPYFVGAATLFAVGGAIAGAAIDTTPRKIFDGSTPTIGENSVVRDTPGAAQALTANHYALESGGETYEVGELRERGLYSQDRYARVAYARDIEVGSVDFDYAAADAEQRRWEAEQQRASATQRVAYREVRRTTRQPAPRPLDLQRPARVSETGAASRISYVSEPVVQDTSAMTRR